MADDEILENELMPNNSEAQGVYVPEPDNDQQEETAEEDTKMAMAEPLYEEMIEWFDEQIKICDSVEQVRITAKAYGKAKLEDALIAHDIVRTLLDNKRAEFDSRFTAYKAKQKDKGDDDEG